MCAATPATTIIGLKVVLMAGLTPTFYPISNAWKTGQTVGTAETPTGAAKTAHSMYPEVPAKTRSSKLSWMQGRRRDTS